MKKEEISNYIKELILKGDIKTFEKKIKLKSFKSVIEKPYKVTGGGRNYQYFSIMYPDLVKFSENINENTIDMLYQLYGINPDYIEFYRDSRDWDKRTVTMSFPVLKLINSSDKMLKMTRHLEGSERGLWIDMNGMITKSILSLKKNEVLYLLKNSKLIDTKGKEYNLFNGYDEFSPKVFEFYKKMKFQYEDAFLFNKKCIGSKDIEIMLKVLYNQPLDKRSVEDAINKITFVIYYDQDGYFSEETMKKFIKTIFDSTGRIDVDKIKFLPMRNYDDYDNYKGEILYSVIRQLPEFQFLFTKEKLTSEEYNKVRNFAQGELIPALADLSQVELKDKGIILKNIEVFYEKHRKHYIGIFKGNEK